MVTLKESHVTLKYVQSPSHKMTISSCLHVLFCIISGDGIYDKLSNEEVVSIVWDTLVRDEGKFKNVH